MNTYLPVIAIKRHFPLINNYGDCGLMTMIESQIKLTKFLVENLDSINVIFLPSPSLRNCVNEIYF